MKITRVAAFVCLALAPHALSWAGLVATPPGAPGLPHSWGPALKQAIGTAYESSGAQSPVWFTVSEGVLTEVFYPTVDQPQVGDLQFLITDGTSFFSEQKRDTISTVTYLDDGATVVISGKDRSNRYSFDEQIITDGASPVLRVRYDFRFQQPGLHVYILFKPAINNGVEQNLGSANSQGLFASNLGLLLPRDRRSQPVQLALLSNATWARSSVGYVGFSDGWQDLSKNFTLTQTWPEAGPGNIALTGELGIPQGNEFHFELALGFGASKNEATTYAQTALTVPFDQERARFDKAWAQYVGSLDVKTAFNKRSAMLIKAHEDKIHRGGIVASLSKPAIPGGERADDKTGGYHLVWPRDLYYAAMGLLAAGDRKTPVDVLHFLVSNQQSDGSWTQNFWVDGTPYWTGIQLDEVSFPILLAYHLNKRNIWPLSEADLSMIKHAADYISRVGPRTGQDRWEEVGGYVPPTLAAEIAALRAAAQLTGTKAYADLADTWAGKIDTWTLVKNGDYGSNYYLRASPTGNPDNSEVLQLANGAGVAIASTIIDGGFLQLPLLGIKSASDPAILNTMTIYESTQLDIAEQSPKIPGAMIYKRYNRDNYGPRSIGGYWPLLAGERGKFAVLSGDLGRAQAQLTMLESSALSSGLIPEQLIAPLSAKTAGLGVACPLVWAHAEDLILMKSLDDRKVFDSP